MILSKEEVDSLIRVEHRSPHQLLGMHPLGDGTGIVVRAFVPLAAEIEVLPTHEPGKPKFKLKKIHDAGLFEGVSKKSSQVYAYDLKVLESSGHEYTGRDPFSFLPTIGESDLFLFNEGNERKIYDKLGAHVRTVDGVPGTSFGVWAPNAQRISVVGDFNHWDGRRHPMRLLGVSGVWEIFIPDVHEGAHYKYEIKTLGGKIAIKTDPYGFFFEAAPKNASIVWNNSRYQWNDAAWIKKRSEQNWLQRPVSIYEVHLGSWRKKSFFESLNYREIAEPLANYLREKGFTHVEFLPLSEHAYYPSWGYQVTGFFSPTARYGTPDDFQYLIDHLHQHGIGVIMDWVPAHFPRDDWALSQFDGTALYEHADPRQGAHQDWGTLIFNYARHEVRNFLTANALFWCERFHIDGLRVDAVASMLYLDYSRNEGEWVPNKHGGRENIDAVEFLKHFNHVVHTEFPGILTIAEESTAWPQVTRPPYLGGLGFSLKWNMGWMHDTLNYFQRDTVFRKYHQNDLTFAMVYHYNENFLLPISHDEIVHGKGSLVGKMPGDEWQQFANLRALLTYQWMFPGKKLLMMGCEVGQRSEWNANGSVEWWLLNEGPYHAGISRLIADLNHLYKEEPALWETDFLHGGFFWIDASDAESSVISFVRQDSKRTSVLIILMNLTPVLRTGYRIGLPRKGFWSEVFNSDAEIYGGGNHGNLGGVWTEDQKCHGQNFSASFTLPPLGVTVLKLDE